MDGPRRLPARTVGWFLPQSRTGWVLFAFMVGVSAPLEAVVFAPNPASPLWGVLAGSFVVASGMSYRYTRIRERWARELDAFDMATLQDARGRGAALVGMAIMIGAVLAVPLVLIFP